ncbi:MAG: hypothetical protein ACE5IO_01835 [Thermoplasmata archaeon]
MKKVVLVIVLVLMLALSPTVAVAEEYERIVFRVHNLPLPLDEVYRTQLLVQENAPHVIEIDSSPTDPSTSDIILMVDIDSESDQIVMVHRGGVNSSTENWQPFFSQYSLEITNNGHFNLTVNMTIIQTGPPATRNSFELWDVLAPVITLTVVPPVILALVLALYGRRWNGVSA